MACIAFVGYRACGKTTLGRLVASHIGFRFVDLDALIETHLGESIRQYFSRQGEAAFRQIEHDILAQTVKTPENILLSTGGGCVLREENRQILREKCTKIIYIRVDVAELQKRLTSNDGDRPSLTGQSVIAEVPQLLSQREPLYMAVAHHVVDGNGAIATVLSRVLAIVENLD